MTLLPVVVRELISASRRKETYYSRLFAPTVAIIILLWMLLLGAARASFLQQGQTLFQILAWLSFIYCLLVGAVATADVLSHEKREGTLGLLFLTPLRGYDVVLGKLAAKALPSCYTQISIIPFLSIALLLGGVTMTEVLRLSIVLGNTMFVSLAAGLFISTFSQVPRRAMFAAAALMLALSFGPYLAAEYLTRGLNSYVFQGLDERFLTISPFFAFNLVADSWRGKFLPEEFRASLVSTHLVGWLFIALSSITLPRLSRNPIKNRWIRYYDLIKERWAYGNRATRGARRTRLLDKNPYQWLSSRQFRRNSYAWLLLGGFGGIWTWVYFYFPDLVMDWPTTLILTLIALAALKVWYGTETCIRLLDDRRSGALELLLCTPMPATAIAEGQGRSLRAMFLWPIVTLVIVEYFLIRAGFNRFRHGIEPEEIWAYFISTAVILGFDLLALKWCGLWEAMLEGTPTRVLSRILFKILVLPWLAVIFCFVPIMLTAANFGLSVNGNDVLITLWTFFSLVNDGWWFFRSHRRFKHHLRRVASEGWGASTASPIQSETESPATKQTSVTSPPLVRLRQLWSRHPVLGSIAAFFLAIAVGVSAYRYAMQRRLDHYLAELATAGQPATLADLEKWQKPAVRPGNDAAGSLTAALAAIVQSPNNQFLYRHGRLRDNSLSSQEWQYIRAALMLNRIPLRELNAALGYPECSSLVDWSDPYGPKTMNLWKINLATQLLYWQARTELEQDDPIQAIGTIRKLLLLARFSGSQPMSQFQYYRCNILNCAAETLEQLMADNPLPADILNEFSDALELAEKNQYTANAIIGERSTLLAYRDNLSALISQTFGMSSQSEHTMLMVYGFFGKVTGLQSRDYLDLMRRLDATIEAARLEYPEKKNKADDLLAHEISNSKPHFFIWFQHLPRSAAQIITTEAMSYSQLRAARTALAVEKFRLAEGHLPHDINELVPKYLPALLQDPALQVPYQLTLLGEGGYRVHSSSSTRATSKKSRSSLEFGSFEVRR